MRRLIHSPWFWLAAFAVWFGALWWLSSRVQHFPSALDFRSSDKVLHFGYFFGGGGLFSAFLFRLNPAAPNWARIFVLTFVFGAATGLTDEWHQTKVPGRSGNDPADFTADILGAMCGALVFRKVHRVLT